MIGWRWLQPAVTTKQKLHWPRRPNPRIANYKLPPMILQGSQFNFIPEAFEEADRDRHK